MSFDADEEILQDFLIEAGEILEQLSEQLVDLENRPDDYDLLNAIFRGFHTVKGGAGFLQIENLVALCHVAENVFDKLRNGEAAVTPELMDVVLQALDAINDMFESIHQRVEPNAAEPHILEALHEIAAGAKAAPAEEAAASEPEAKPASAGDFEAASDQLAEEEAKAQMGGESTSGSSEDDITEDEFEAILDQLHGEGKGPATGSESEAPAADAKPASDSDEITDEEFQDLLDQLHGSNKAPGADAAKAGGDGASEAKAPAAGGDDITDDEFENLLDTLHGEGKGPTVAKAPAEPAPAAPKEAPKAAPAASAPPAEKKAPAPAPAEKEIAKPKAKLAPKPAANKAPAARDGGSEASVRVDTKRLDDIMNMVGELVLVRNRLVRLGIKSQDENIAKAVANLDVVTGDLQTSVMKTRMQPIKKVFGRFPRVVRDLARNLKKEIKLELEGEETDLDKNLVEALADPLVHLVRNSVDHGIEAPDKRENAGKPREGTVVLSAEQEGDHIVLSITDDGGGVDSDVLRGKAVEKGLMDQEAADRLSDHECYNLIFHPGFSTKEEISDVSGRGVGMDVVKTKITQLNGTIDVQSQKGQGTRIAIKVPLTLAIMPTLMVVLGEQAFALPLVSVNEIFHLDLTKTNVVDGQECVVVREKALPLFYLKRWLVQQQNSGEEQSAHVVVVTVGTQKVGFVVDQLIGQEEVVIKPLGKMLNGTPGMAGATITGDGRIALILDVPSMLKAYAGRF